MPTHLEQELSTLGSRTGAPAEQVARAVSALQVQLAAGVKPPRELLLTYACAVGEQGGWVRVIEVNEVLKHLSEDPLHRGEVTRLQRCIESGRGRNRAWTDSFAEAVIQRLENLRSVSIPQAQIQVPQVDTSRSAIEKHIERRYNLYLLGVSVSGGSAISVILSYFLTSGPDFALHAGAVTVLTGMTGILSLRARRTQQLLERP